MDKQACSAKGKYIFNTKRTGKLITSKKNLKNFSHFPQLNEQKYL